MTKKKTKSREKKPLTAKQLKECTEVLEAKRDKIIRDAAGELDVVRDGSQERLSDEVDVASAEWDQAVNMRMRDRDKHLLNKVRKALQRISDGEYDECASCGNYIGYPRLATRPEATLCIECKEEQEQVEKTFNKTRVFDQQFPFK